MIHVPDYVRGNPKAKLQLVEYADFECPYCGQAYPCVKQLAERFPNDLAEVFRPFPLANIHPHAMHAAQAAEAAGLQGKFWQMHDVLFEHQEHLEDRDLLRYANEIGLNVDQFERDFAGTEVKESIARSVRQGEEARIEGTPTFFLNGKMLELARYEDLENIVAAAIKDS